MAASPTQRTLKLYRDRGYVAEVVEKWIPRVNIRKDLFGFIDIVSIHPDSKGCIGVQATSRGNMSARRNKILDIDDAKTWLNAGNRIVIIGWDKPKHRLRYKETEVTIDDFS